MIAPRISTARSLRKAIGRSHLMDDVMLNELPRKVKRTDSEYIEPFLMSQELMRKKEKVLRRWSDLKRFPRFLPLGLEGWPKNANGSNPELIVLMALAIWGSPDKRLTLREIIGAINKHFPIVGNYEAIRRKSRVTSIRHTLSRKQCFIRMNRPWYYDGDGKGGLWTIDPSMYKLDSRERSELKPKKWSKSLGSSHFQKTMSLCQNSFAINATLPQHSQVHVAHKTPESVASSFYTEQLAYQVPAIEPVRYGYAPAFAQPDEVALNYSQYINAPFDQAPSPVDVDLDFDFDTLSLDRYSAQGDIDVFQPYQELECSICPRISRRSMRGSL